MPKNECLQKIMKRVRIPNILTIIERSCHTKSKIKLEPTVIVHAGSGEYAESLIPYKLEGLKKAAKKGYQVLMESKSVTNSVEAAIYDMEDFTLFNAGRGSVLTAKGDVELEASIMAGTLQAGAVAAVTQHGHPISIARHVQEKTVHMLLIANGVHKFAVSQGMKPVRPGTLITKEARQQFEEVTDYSKNNVLGAAGAIVIDEEGHVAAGSSTGGLNRKMVGRCGSCCIIGAGIYADDRIGAVVATGEGESLIKTCMSYAIAKEMEHGLSALEACQKCIMYVNLRLNRETGAIAISNKGDIGIAFNSKHMSWAYQKGNEIHFGIEINEHKTERI